MYNVIYKLNGKEYLNQYESRQEASYYAKVNSGKVIFKYRICDLSKGMFSDDVFILAETPLKAVQKYFKQLGEERKVKRDLNNTGDIVVYGSRSSYVYKTINQNK